MLRFVEWIKVKYLEKNKEEEEEEEKERKKRQTACGKKVMKRFDKVVKKSLKDVEVGKNTKNDERFRIGTDDVRRWWVWRNKS